MAPDRAHVLTKIKLTTTADVAHPDPFAPTSYLYSGISPPIQTK